MALVEELKSLIKGEVVNDPATLHLYGTDASAFRITPQAVVFPLDIGDIKKLVKYVYENTRSSLPLSLTVRSAGTDMTGGPLNDSIIIDIARHLNRIKRINRDSAVIEPGVMYRDFEKQALQHKLFFPSYPASKMLASIGGIVANNSGGEKTLRYGKTERYVQEVKAILQDGNEYTFKELNHEQLSYKLKLRTFEGEVYRGIHRLIVRHYAAIRKAEPHVSKNSTGYLLWKVWDKQRDMFDLSKLFVGSQGTLGIITQATLNLVPVEKHSKMMVIYLRSLDTLADIVNAILPYGPTSLESYDDKTLKLALKFAPQLARLIGKDQNLFTFAMQLLPDFFIMLRRGFPRLVIMAEFTGNHLAQVNEKLQQAKEALTPFNLPIHIPKDDEESQKYWTIRRQSFNLLRNNIKSKQTVPFIDDIIVNPQLMPEFLPQLNKILSHYPKLIFTIAGHVGDGNFHIIPLMDMTDRTQRHLIPVISKQVYNLVLKYGGSLSAEHNDGLIRGPYLRQMYGDQIYLLFREVKRIFDPHNIFNPHKKTDANLEFSMHYIKKDNEHSV